MSDNMSGTSEPERRRNDSDDETEGMVGRTLTPQGGGGPSEGPDVYLNVPELKVEEISLEVENLEAHVSLVAQVLDLLKLNVGADAFLGRVKLEIKGVEAQARLDVRLDNVALIVDRVLTTLDRNPEILQHVGRGVEEAARSIGGGAGTAVGEVGKGARGAVQDVGKGAGGAVESVGSGAEDAVRDVGKGAGEATQEVGKGAGEATQEVGKGAGEATQEVGKGAGEATQEVGKGAGEATQGVGKGAESAAEEVGDQAGQAAQPATEGAAATAREAGKATGEASGNQNGGIQRREAEPRTTEAAEDAAKNGQDAAKDAGEGAGDREEHEITALRNAYRDTEESVRDLGRALFRMVTQGSRPS